MSAMTLMSTPANPQTALAELSSAAAEFLGPIAEVLVQRLAGRAVSFVQLREDVALQIENSRSREVFRERTQTLVRRSRLIPAAVQAPPAEPAAAVAGLEGREPLLLQELAELLRPSLGPLAGRIVAEQAARSLTRVQLFLKLARLVPDAAQRRALELRALRDHHSRLR
jgi:hypothetical protein